MRTMMVKQVDALFHALYDTRMWASKNYRDAVDIQKLIAIDAKKPDCDPKIRCLLARAYKELEELKLRLRMKPAPKPIDVSVKKKNEAPSVTLE